MSETLNVYVLDIDDWDYDDIEEMTVVARTPTEARRLASLYARRDVSAYRREAVGASWLKANCKKASTSHPRVVSSAYHYG